MIRFTRPQGGLYLWCRVPSAISTRDLRDRALTAGVAFVPGHAFYSDPAGESELRLCFSSVMPSAIDDAVHRLAACLSRSGTPALRVARDIEAAGSLRTGT
jgi:DNA-binding transcriptional MocR family regulator